MANPIKDKIARGKPAIGVSIMFPSAQLVEMAGRLGYDWVLIDCEHGSISVEQAERMITAAEAAGIVPVVRPPSDDPDIIGQLMDCGAKGIQAPHIRTAKEAEKIVDAVKYFPEGHRSIAVGTRAAHYGFNLSMAEYAEKSNEEMLVCIQIEDKEALAELPEIYKVKGIDVLFIGPSDLSQSLGHPGDYEHPVVKEAISDAFRFIESIGIAAGTAGNIDYLPKRLGQGVLYYYVHITTLLKYSTQEVFRKLQEAEE